MKRLIWVLSVVSTGVLVVGCPAFPGACDYGGCLDGGDVTVTDGLVPDRAATDGDADCGQRRSEWRGCG